MLANESPTQLTVFMSLLGGLGNPGKEMDKQTKPFECVGTAAEAAAAVHMAAARIVKTGVLKEDLPVILLKMCCRLSILDADLCEGKAFLLDEQQILSHWLPSLSSQKD